MHQFLSPRVFTSMALALALSASLGALAQSPANISTDTPAEIKALRQEIDAMRNDYEARLQAMERRLKVAEALSPAVSAPLTANAPTVAPAPAPASSSGGMNAFNPAMSLILSGTYTRTSLDPQKYAITGFPLPASAAPGVGSRGLSLAESELDFSASIDPWFRGAANISLRPDDTVAVEEAYVQTTALGSGFSLKAGRFFSSVGYLNSQHAHTWDFVDNPLAYQAMLGTQYGDDGLQLKWLAPIDHYVELGAEVGRGRSFPGTDTGRNGAGMTALTAHSGGDIGESSSWRAGVSMLNAKANEQDLIGFNSTNSTNSPITNAFSGSTRVWIADAILKWAPNGNATRTSFKLQGEYLRSTRKGQLLDDAATTAALRTVQSGWYLQGVYQFTPRWRVGLRTERLNPGAPDDGTLAGLFAPHGYRPHKNTLMFDFNLSEFSRMRLQLARDNARQGFTDNQLLLQYQMSLGAHGAHNY